MKCIIIESSPERTNAHPVTNENGTPYIYGTMKEARAELKANGYSYNRVNDRYYIVGTDYRAYIIREDSDEYAKIIEQAEQAAAPEHIEPKPVQTVAGHPIYATCIDCTTGENVFTIDDLATGNRFWTLAEARYYCQCNPVEKHTEDNEKAATIATKEAETAAANIIDNANATAAEINRVISAKVKVIRDACQIVKNAATEAQSTEDAARLEELSDEAQAAAKAASSKLRDAWNSMYTAAEYMHKAQRSAAAYKAQSTRADDRAEVAAYTFNTGSDAAQEAINRANADAAKKHAKAAAADRAAQIVQVAYEHAYIAFLTAKDEAAEAKHTAEAIAQQAANDDPEAIAAHLVARAEIAGKKCATPAHYAIVDDMVKAIFSAAKASRQATANRAALALIDAYIDAIDEYPASIEAVYSVAHVEITGTQAPAEIAEHRAIVDEMVLDIAEQVKCEASAAADARAEWDGEGLYRIAWSDGGQKSDPRHCETAEELARDLEEAYRSATETHQPYAERIEYYDRAELLAYLGWPEVFDVDAIEQEATDTDEHGRRFWTVTDPDEFIELVQRHDLSATR